MLLGVLIVLRLRAHVLMLPALAPIDYEDYHVSGHNRFLSFHWELQEHCHDLGLEPQEESLLPATPSDQCRTFQIIYRQSCSYYTINARVILFIALAFDSISTKECCYQCRNSDKVSWSDITNNCCCFVSTH